MPFKSCLRCCGILLQLPTEILRINLSARFFVLVTHKVFFIVSQIYFVHRVNYLLSGVEWSVKIEFTIENGNCLERKKSLANTQSNLVIGSSQMALVVR